MYNKIYIGLNRNDEIKKNKFRMLGFELEF